MSSLTCNTSVPLVFARAPVLSVSYYSSSVAVQASQDIVNASTLGLVQGTSKYHHAQLKVEVGVGTATGEHATTTVVTSQSTITSDTTAIVEVVGSRLKALSPGQSTIAATFGGLSSSTTVEVSDAVLDPITAVTVTASLSSQSTLRKVQNGTEQCGIRLNFQSGLVFNNVGDLDWLTIPEVVTLQSNNPSKIGVDSSGLLTLFDNHYERVGISATTTREQGGISAAAGGSPLGARSWPAGR